MEINDELKTNISSTDTWLRLLLIAVLGFITSIIAIPAVWVLAGVQFVFSLLTGQPNENLFRINQNIAAWLNQVFRYMLYVSDSKPFPLSDLPDEEPPASMQDTAQTDTPSASKSEVKASNTETEEEVS